MKIDRPGLDELLFLSIAFLVVTYSTEQYIEQGEVIDLIGLPIDFPFQM